MNSLVVLFSIMALAAAKPSIVAPVVTSYAVPAVSVAPSAVSHQSRVDIKSSPAEITETVAPVSRAVIAEPAIVAGPAAYAPIAYSAFDYAAPAAYAAPIAISAPAAVSSQSRLEVKSSPAVVSTVAAAPVFNTFAGAPVAYTAPIATYTQSIYTPAIAAAVPGIKTAIAPATSVDAADLPVAPTETPEVAAARAAHLEAKALEEHKIQKRAVFATAPVVSTYPASPIISSYATPFVYPSPIARIGTPIVSAPVLTAYGVHPY